MTNLINKLTKLAMIPIITGSLNGCRDGRESVETKFVYMNPEAYENTEIKYNADSNKIILPTNLVSYVGYTETYGNAKHPRKVSIGGQGAISGTGYDFNEDGVFDKLEKDNPNDNFTFTELEKILNEVKEKAKDVTDRNMISEKWEMKIK